MLDHSRVMKTQIVAVLVFLLAGCGSSTFTPTGDADAGSDPATETTSDPAVDPVVEPEEDVVIPDLPAEVVEDPVVEVMPDGTGPCMTDGDCDIGLNCCTGRCVNFAHDPQNCGGCGNLCPNTSRYCDAGTCTAPPCAGVTCIGTQFCCGASCCDLDQICCIVEGPGPVGAPQCYDDFCPGGCPSCD